MIVLAFTGDGYLKTYSKYEHDRRFWLGSALSGGLKCVRESFTKNVRCKVLGKSEALLIVYEDQEF
ncbi:hypothetical protein BEWA_041370 [Theileria equi strain WA]|uniref:Uncharacterized protein n=1 Tax=Theileria equi strain WA TaxID=1537102 RepID=L1LFP7_THEEQ|nr:hypothetical protein BEWA_041370 [Theileria equi strain WA]EKX74099.1 hypothetical protein BEWA_041370 [Theileria equi strain WA]|eukprot:XP_004833551.1 hypothetical protein BEWA_041370 [Theileria equi strain WA]